MQHLVTLAVVVVVQAALELMAAQAHHRERVVQEQAVL